MEIGKDKLGRPVCWDPVNAANGHLFSIGSTGYGKTYNLSGLLKLYVECGLPAIIVDSTNKFRETLLEVGIAESNIEEYFVYKQGLPVNPFKKQMNQVGNENILETDEDVVERVLGYLNLIIGRAPRQKARMRSVLTETIENFAESTTFMSVKRANLHYDDAISLCLDDKLTILRKLKSSEYEIEWENILQKKKIFILNLSGYKNEMLQLVSEILLQDIWFFVKNRVVASKFVLCLDEIQNYKFSENSILCTFLAECRKYKVAIWGATQNFKSNFPSKVKELLMQSGLKIFFKPSDEESADVAKLIDRKEYIFWENILKQLKVGDCICFGELYTAGHNVNVPIILRRSQ